MKKPKRITVILNKTQHIVHIPPESEAVILSEITQANKKIQSLQEEYPHLARHEHLHLYIIWRAGLYAEEKNENKETFKKQLDLWNQTLQNLNVTK